MLVDTDLPQKGGSGVKKIYFGPEDSIYFAVQIDQLCARALARTRVVAIQRHDFRVPATNLRLLSHTSIPPLCAGELAAQPSSRSFLFPPW